MATIKVTENGVTRRSASVTLRTAIAAAPPTTAGAWPFSVPEPTLPTGLTALTSGAGAGRDGVEWRGLKGIDATVNNKRVVYRDCQFSYLNITYPAEDIWVLGGELGPMGGGIHAAVASGFQASVARRVVFDGVYIHGMHQGKIDDHTEGLQVGGVDTLIVRNCRFEDNHIFNLFMRCWSPAIIRCFLIENNTMPACRDINGGQTAYAMRVAGAGDATKPTDGVIRGNRTATPISVDDPVGQRIRVEGNAAL